jgi:hypothetical protein
MNSLSAVAGESLSTRGGDQLIRAGDPLGRQYSELYHNWGKLSHDQLIDFAADDSCPSLLVRAAALDAALAPRTAKSADSRQRTALQQLAPDVLDEGVVSASRVLLKGDATDYTGNLAQYTFSLARAEGFDTNSIFPDPHEWSFDPIGMTEDIAVRAFLLLEGVANKVVAGERLPVNGYTKLLPLALDINYKLGNRFLKISDEGEKDLRALGNISRLVDYGDDHVPQIEQLLARNTPETRHYISEINELYEVASQLKNIFPERYAPGVEKGVRELIASSLFAVEAHLSNDRHTQTSLPLLSGKEGLPLQLDGSEPLELLSALKMAIQKLNEIHGDRDGYVTRSVVSDEFGLYRLMSTDQKSASVYIRPYGSHRYDPRMEYGRNGEGVEASISFVVDPFQAPGSLPEVGKHRGKDPDNRISIRLDREGHAPGAVAGSDRNPAQEHGTLSLDVGSVIGDDAWLGTRIGRLLAYGNHLRMQALGRETKLNHVTHYFAEEDGRAAVFGAQAESLMRGLDSQCLNRDQLLHRHHGGQVLQLIG